MNESRFMVYVSCMTYNQSLYIKEALDSFCMQRTNFPYICCIIDDASTDGEQEIIKRYFEENFVLDGMAALEEETDDYQSVFTQHKTNKNCFFVAIYLKYNHKQIKKSKSTYTAKWRGMSKYYAVCEGDDYWIDPLKLQKQVDFMEAHPQHSLCFCANRELFPTGEYKDVYQYASDVEVCPMADIIKGGGSYMATNTMLYRISMYIPHTTWTRNCPVGDLPIMLSLAQAGMVGYIHDLMSVYRKGAAGSWSQKMASSFKNRRKHHKAIIDMWHRFDRYSKYQYHDAVVKKIRINKKDFWRGIIFSPLTSIKRVLFEGNRRNQKN